MSQIVLTSDALVATPTAGALEYTSPVIYATPVGTQRGVIPNSQFYRLDANYAGLNATGAQGVFGVGTGGAGIGVTLSSSTAYAFDSTVIFIKNAGVTSHTFSIGFGGTATVNNILCEVFSGGINQASLPVVTDTAVYSSTNSTSGLTITSGGVVTANRIQTVRWTGSVSINAGGTFVPQYTLSAAPGGAYSTVAGSYFLIYPISTSGANTSVGTWS